ncbi:putative ATPase [Catenulispora sp. GAS73]|uniref:AAA family ATPase n=1 Tax=Catenulispora sp. GAS73 TaxID=3156269 RepID=UPI003516B06E
MGVSGRRDLDTARPAGTFAFVGREHERELESVMIEGPAGIGKSRLISEAASAIAEAGGRTLTGVCHPLRELFPYGPVVDALRKAGPWLSA